MSENNPLLRINNSIDVLISKHGSQKAAVILEALSVQDNTAIHSNSTDLQKFIIKQCIALHGVTQRYFAIGKNSDYKQARITCFYLLHTHCNLSCAKIKTLFPQYPHTRGKIQADINQMKNIIDLPRIDKDHHAKYTQLNEIIIEYKKL